VNRTMLSQSPYRSLNLWRNPFGELTRQERAELALVDLQPWTELLRDERKVIQFIGPCGHGKTTHLLAIQKAIAVAPYVCFPEDGPRPQVASIRPIIVDEAQRMPWWQLRSVLKRGGPLVFGTHNDLSKPVLRAGLSVHTIDLSSPVTASHLAEMLNRRIEASRLNDDTIPRITEPDAIRLQHAFGTDIRAIEHCLYDQFQRCVSEQIPWPTAN
jgi:hypothetical protein